MKIQLQVLTEIEFTHALIYDYDNIRTYVALGGESDMNLLKHELQARSGSGAWNYRIITLLNWT